MEYAMFRYWSVVHGMHVARLSVAGADGGELFIIVPQDGSGGQNRAKKARGLDLLEAAVASKTEAGEIPYTQGD